MSETEIITLSIAEKYYRNHLKAMSNYQKKYPEKNAMKQKIFRDKQRLERPEEYAKFLEKQRENYRKRKEKKSQDIN
jgi:hypothetical protein